MKRIKEFCVDCLDRLFMFMTPTEWLVIISVVLILIALIMPAVNQAIEQQEKARQTQISDDLKTVDESGNLVDNDREQMGHKRIDRLEKEVESLREDLNQLIHALDKADKENGFVGKVGHGS